MDYTLPQLLQTLHQQGGSDLHIAAGSAPRLRIDGAIRPLQLPPLSSTESRELCYSVLKDQQRKKFETIQEIDLSFSVENLCRFRANIFFDRGAVAATFRAIPNEIYTLEGLGLPLAAREICEKKKGLVLVTGPTGSGKSTSLSAMVDHINQTQYGHIVTIEDPIEFVHPHKNCIVHQREVGSDTDSFQRALKSILRQDPDVVLVGELRDLETISAAITTAETGHLVFATLHTNSCVSTLNRLIDVFPPHQQDQIRVQLSMNLAAIFSQSLLPSLSGGRVLAMEIMQINTPIAAMIHEGKFNQIYSAMQAGQDGSGNQTMNQALYALIQRRLITKDEAFIQSPDADELTKMIANPNSQRKLKTVPTALSSRKA